MKYLSEVLRVIPGLGTHDTARNGEETGHGIPRVFVSESKVEVLRASGASWRTIAKELGVCIGTVRRAAQSRAKIGCGTSFDGGPEVLHV